VAIFSWACINIVEKINSKAAALIRFKFKYSLLVFMWLGLKLWSPLNSEAVQGFPNMIDV